jgi:hypothetical protein
MLTDKRLAIEQGTCGNLLGGWGRKESQARSLDNFGWRWETAIPEEHCI